jgi:hypothetical protein
MADDTNEILQRLTRIETRLEMMIADPSKDKRIFDLEDNQRWLWRAIFGTFISGAIAYLFKMM